MYDPSNVFCGEVALRQFSRDVYKYVAIAILCYIIILFYSICTLYSYSTIYFILFYILITFFIYLFVCLFIYTFIFFTYNCIKIFYGVNKKFYKPLEINGVLKICIIKIGEMNHIRILYV